jgi:hypothetical protein
MKIKIILLLKVNMDDLPPPPIPNQGLCNLVEDTSLIAQPPTDFSESQLIESSFVDNELEW